MLISQLDLVTVAPFTAFIVLRLRQLVVIFSWLADDIKQVVQTLLIELIAELLEHIVGHLSQERLRLGQLSNEEIKEN